MGQDDDGTGRGNMNMVSLLLLESVGVRRGLDDSQNRLEDDLLDMLVKKGGFWILSKLFVAFSPTGVLLPAVRWRRQ
jgi:hypothetical protein